MAGFLTFGHAADFSFALGGLINDSFIAETAALAYAIELIVRDLWIQVDNVPVVSTAQHKTFHSILVQNYLGRKMRSLSGFGFQNLARARGTDSVRVIWTKGHIIVGHHEYIEQEMLPNLKPFASTRPMFFTPVVFLPCHVRIMRFKPLIVKICQR